MNLLAKLQTVSAELARESELMNAAIEELERAVRESNPSIEVQVKVTDGNLVFGWGRKAGEWGFFVSTDGEKKPIAQASRVERVAFANCARQIVEDLVRAAESMTIACGVAADTIAMAIDRVDEASQAGTEGKGQKP